MFHWQYNYYGVFSKLSELFFPQKKIAQEAKNFAFKFQLKTKQKAQTAKKQFYFPEND